MKEPVSIRKDSRSLQGIFVGSWKSNLFAQFSFVANRQKIAEGKKALIKKEKKCASGIYALIRVSSGEKLPR